MAMSFFCKVLDFAARTVWRMFEIEDESLGKRFVISEAALNAIVSKSYLLKSGSLNKRELFGIPFVIDKFASTHIRLEVWPKDEKDLEVKKVEVEEEKPMPCPFCGEETLTYAYHSAGGKAMYRVCCKECSYHSKAYYKKDEAIAAHNRVCKAVAAKDAEIKNLKWKVENYAQVVAAKGREIAKRDALIKELADELETQVDCDDDCNECEDCGNCPTAAQEWRKLIKKAREVVK